jgi:hypothetical protein
MRTFSGLHFLFRAIETWPARPFPKEGGQVSPSEGAAGAPSVQEKENVRLKPPFFGFSNPHQHFSRAHSAFQRGLAHKTKDSLW